MGATPARRLAARVVARVRVRESYAHESMQSELSRTDLDAREAAFATRLAYGTVACRGTLDEAIERFLTRPGSLQADVSDRLALSAYELLFARTPVRAAVDQGVELVREVAPRAAGFANAVLRKLAAAAPDFPWGDPLSDASAFARLYGHPEWMATLWTRELGRELAASIMEADNEPAPLYLAHLPFAGSFDEALDVLSREGAEPTECGPEGCIVAGNGSRAVKSTALTRHLVVVADAAAQFVAACAMPGPVEHVIELGAGRGTKSLLLAGRARLLGAESRITAVDLHEFKLEALKKLAAELNVPNIDTCVADATDVGSAALAELRGADVVLVDAPCSGLGTLRRHPDRRWRAKPEEMESLATLGGRLLESAALLVKPGGFVVYSTCTIAQQENEDVIAGFLGSGAGAGFSVDPLGGSVPSGWEGFITDEGWFRSLPTIGGPDGHFAARLLRRY